MLSRKELFKRYKMSKNVSIEVLLSIMNIKNKEQFENVLKSNNITGQVVAVNQVKNNEDIFNIESNKKRLYSYNEKGASKSRNRLLEKSSGDICIFADDDMVYNRQYEDIIKSEYQKNQKADIIIFNIENQNKEREKIKKIKNRKLNIFNIMKARTPEITLKNDVIKKYNIKFDENFGPKGIFSKGEETVFLSECLKKGINICVSQKNIGYVYSKKSTWFTGFDEKYLYDQGAIFYKIAPKIYKLLIIQYIIRKYFLYRKNANVKQAYKQMLAGAKKCKEIYGDKENG